MMSATDAIAEFRRTLDQLDSWSGVVRKGFAANVLGVLTDVKYLDLNPEGRPESLGPYQADPAPPAVTDGEVFFEWLDVFEAVREAKDRFTMIELGGGYAARSVDAHALLQRFNPLSAKFVVVEAEPTHFAWAKEHFVNNGVDWREHWFLNTAISDSDTPVFFPIGEGLYSNPVLDERARRLLYMSVAKAEITDQVLFNLLNDFCMGISMTDTNGEQERSFDFGIRSAITLTNVLGPLDRVDLIDVDIQRAERQVLPAAIEHLNQKVKRLHVGTHLVLDGSGDIHGELEALFREHGWEVIFSYPPFATHETEFGSFSTKDGILTVTNPRLA